MDAHSKTGAGREAEQEFDAARYLRYLGRQWQIIAAACGVALVIALGVSLMLTKRYTSTASILIEPPAGSDPRTLTAVSPVYLESLKTYEMFASSDSLFSRAADHFGLRQDKTGTSVESLKRRVLKVSKLRDTKLLQISATLPDSQQAQQMAQFIAEETIKLSGQINRETNQDLIEETQKQLDSASAQLNKTQTALAQFSGREPVESLRLELDSLSELRHGAERDLIETETQLADVTARGKALSDSPESSSERDYVARTEPSLKARVELLSKQSAALLQRIDTTSKLLEQRISGREALEAANKSAQASFEAATNRLRDARGSSAYAGERLKVVDPGIVAQRPSSPNIGLNCFAAIGLALIGVLAYLSVRFTLSL